MIKNIMVAVDGSPPATRTLALGADLAMRYGAELHLVHVVSEMTLPEGFEEFARIERVDQPAWLEMGRVGEAVLEKARAGATAKGVQDVRTQVLTGDPAERLLGHAHEHAMPQGTSRHAVSPIHRRRCQWVDTASPSHACLTDRRAGTATRAGRGLAHPLPALIPRGWVMERRGTRSGYRLFSDRGEAGTRLAEALDDYRGKDVVILGIPRGGVPVAAEVARRLGAELDIIVARKLGAPMSRELAIGAVTANGGRFLNEELIRELEVSDAYLERVVTEEMAEAHRRETRFRGGRAMASLAGRTVIVVDDGLATGATMRAAVRAVRKQQPARLVVAVPVGSREACTAVAEEADAVVCLDQPVPFFAVGAFYEHLSRRGRRGRAHPRAVAGGSSGGGDARGLTGLGRRDR